jgi:hypothetical protein
MLCDSGLFGTYWIRDGKPEVDPQMLTKEQT